MSALQPIWFNSTPAYENLIANFSFVQCFKHSTPCLPGLIAIDRGQAMPPAKDACPRHDQGLFVGHWRCCHTELASFHDLFLSCSEIFAVKIFTVAYPVCQQISHHCRKAVKFCGSFHPPSIASTPMALSFPPHPSTWFEQLFNLFLPKHCVWTKLGIIFLS